MQINFLHNSRQLQYRSPFGALPTEATVNLSIFSKLQDNIKDIFLHYNYGLKKFHEGRAYLLPNPTQNGFYSVNLKMPDEPCLFFYYFEIHINNEVFYCIKNSTSNDGSSIILKNYPFNNFELCSCKDAFQITVYDKEFTTPDWMKKSVMYQIFPDRFARDKNFSLAKMGKSGNYPDRIYHENWNEEVDFQGKNEKGYLALDFFGGSLTGIKENLKYIKDLGIDVIYLNPIFQSRSNHRYDTADYEKVDPILGGNDAFEKLAKECQKQGINIILDGVFSHTGADSKYYNKYGRYPEIGAYQDAAGMGRSRWYSWYSFNKYCDDISSDCWWGFPELPNVNENDLNYREFILGADGIIRKWVKNGAKGWRLDVSDELPDEFLRGIRKAVKRESSDCIVLGEVWEDASNKISYGGYRDFLLGNTHDCVMGYPFRNSLLNWLTGKSDINSFISDMESIRENYPVEAYLCNMNLIGTHDSPRAITALAGHPDTGNRHWQAKQQLNTNEKHKGLALLRLATLVQFTFPGVPSIYYGDELGMEGYGDPFCRRTINIPDQSDKQPDILNWFKAVSIFRKNNPVLATGFIQYIQNKDNVLIYKRFVQNDKDMTNKPLKNTKEFYIAINPDDKEKQIKLLNSNFILKPISGVIIENKIRVFET